jgi:hypothetical protein
MKRSQAALEFMLTYSWSILVALSVFGLIFYFGALDPGAFMRDTCISGIGLACKGNVLLTHSGVYFTLTNNIGSPLALNTSNIVIPQNCANIYLCDFGNTTCTDTAKQLPDAESFTVVANCTAIENFKGDFVFRYTNVYSGLPETVTVKIMGAVTN